MANNQSKFRFQDYMVYPVDGNLDYKTTPPKEFYLETVDHLVDRLKKSAPLIEQTLGDLPVFLLKNGYIFEDTLYLAKLDFIEIYNLTYPLGKDNGAQIQLTWSKDIPSEQMLTCRLWDSENSQYEETVYMGLFYTLAAIFMAVLVTQRKTKDKGHKFALSPNSLTLVELSDDAIFNK